jgi:MFS family permease
MIIFLTTGGESLPLLIASGLVTALGHSAVSESVNWPLAQAILPPEVRGSSRAATSMVAGGAAALTFFLSGLVADRIGVNSMLLLIVTIPMCLNIVAWIPMLRTYPRDHTTLHQMLAQRREELLGVPV